MNRPPRIDGSEERHADQSAPRTRPPQRGVRRPYVKPRVEQAGSVFSRTRALGSGTKDLINGSALL